MPLDALTAATAPQAGAKASNCARLRRAGFRIPDGVVVLATAADEELAGVADHPWFDAQPTDARYAVRSSAIGEDGVEHSFAGIHHTALDVERHHLAQAAARCRASARSPQALEYRLAHA